MSAYRLSHQSKWVETIQEGETDECARLVYGLFDEGVLAEVLFLTAGPSVTVWAGLLSSLSRQPTEGPIQAGHSLTLSLSLAAPFVYSLNPQSGMRWLLGSPLSPPKCFIDELWLLLLFHMPEKVKCRPPWLHFTASHPKKTYFSPLPLLLLVPPSLSLFSPIHSATFSALVSASKHACPALRLVLPQKLGVHALTRAQRGCFWVRWGVR